MRLSEAIILGASLHPQDFNVLGKIDHDNVLLSTCALGAAMEAISLSVVDALVFGIAPLVDVYPWLRLFGTCPQPSCQHSNHFYSIIAHLNDIHKWTREQIAEWVSTVEPKEEGNGELDKGHCEGICGSADQAGAGTSEETRTETYA